jgi:protein CpxP
MKMSFIKTLLGSLSAGFITLCLAASSWSMPHGAVAEQDPEQLLAHLSRKLELTDEQKGAVEVLLAISFQESVADRERLQALREELRVQHQDFDPGSAQQSAAEVGEITGRIVYRTVSAHAGIYQLLTDEQRVEMEALMARREARRGKRHGHRHGVEH